MRDLHQGQCAWWLAVEQSLDFHCMLACWVQYIYLSSECVARGYATATHSLSSPPEIQYMFINGGMLDSGSVYAIARTAQAVRASTTPLIKVQCNGAWWAGMEELFDECVRLRPRRRGAELYH